MNNPVMVNVDEIEHLPSDCVVDACLKFVSKVRYSMIAVVVVVVVPD